jgi:hypothetical protein
MWELVLIITILGILAANALPRLMGLDEEAQISKSLYLIKVATDEIVTYAFSQMRVEDDLSQMSHTILEGASQGSIRVDIPGRRALFRAGEVEECVILKVERTPRGFDLSIEFGDHQEDRVCRGVQRGINMRGYPVQLRGRFVKM